MKKSAVLTPPEGLSAESARLWADLAEGYRIVDPGGLRILTTACEAYDRYQSARRRIDADGEAILDRWSQLKPHPLIAAERDARAAMLAALRLLRLDVVPIKPVGRPGLWEIK